MHNSNIFSFKKNSGMLVRTMVLALACGFSAHSMAETTRQSTVEFSKDPAKVLALKKGIASMRLDGEADPMSAQFRTSFNYWANTHGYFGTGGNATDLPKYIARRMPECLAVLTKAQCDAYYKHMTNSTVPADGFTQNVWGTCQHGNLNFLPWHRMYLYYFEKTLAKHVGDPNFALPYWDYYGEISPSPAGLAVPPLVRGELSNPLFDQYRTIGLNPGTTAIDPDSASAEQAFEFTDFTNFSNTLQGQPHGAMHCAVGTGCATPDMGFVPIAGLDPVFYMHHANIDRMWQCWLNRKANGQTIDLAWAKANLGMPDSWYDTTYTFADENGAKVTMSIADVFTPGKIPVRYTNETNCATSAPSSATAKTPLLAASAAVSPLAAHSPMGLAKSVELGATVKNVSLIARAKSKLMAAPLASNFNEPGQSYLTLENVVLKGSPALTYKVILVNKAHPEKTAYLATLSYFGVGDHHAGHDAAMANSLGTLTYKVSTSLQKLGVTSVDDVSVRFEPTSLVTGKTKLQKAGSGVTIGNISLETVPAK